MGKKIIVVGSSNTDMVVKVPHIPARGETIMGSVFHIIPGGKGANQVAQGQATHYWELSDPGKIAIDNTGQILHALPSPL